MLALFIDLMGINHTSSRLDIITGKDPKNFEEVSKKSSTFKTQTSPSLVCHSMPRIKKASLFLLPRSLRNSPLGKNYRKGRVQGAKFYRLRHLHRAFLLRPLPDHRKHILST